MAARQWPGSWRARCCWVRAGGDDEGGRADEGTSGAETGWGEPSPVTAEQVRASADALDAATS
ncbi:MAG TPA: hypothetical protein VKA65_09485 [Acidimicrobiales bacterium]|nr:hypothetical protein [Acidimicrobiales bacterium]